MELIVITSPEMLPGEADIINQLFANGLARLHVRKPAATPAELNALLAGIDPQFRGHIALHQHHELAGDMGITGLHFTESNRHAQHTEALEILKNDGFKISTSVHNSEELETLSHCFDYAFLGPVFDSISKEGYVSRIPGDFKLRKHNFPGQVIALGGINSENWKAAIEMGFDGVAVLGAIWQKPNDAIAQFQQLRPLQSSLESSLKGSLESSFSESSFKQFSFRQLSSNQSFSKQSFSTQSFSNQSSSNQSFSNQSSPNQFSSNQFSSNQSSSNLSSSIPGLKPGAKDNVLAKDDALAMDNALPKDFAPATEKPANPEAKAVPCPRFQPGDPKKKEEGGALPKGGASATENLANPIAKAIPSPRFQPGDPKKNEEGGLLPRDGAPATESPANPIAKAIPSPGFQPGDSKKKEEGGFIDKLHFISNETGAMSHIDSIRLALEAGCRWIQLRVKNRMEGDVLPIAWEAIRLCDRYGAKLIINDFPRVALAVEAHGLHLGLTDMPVTQARALVGPKMIIGGTANTWEDITRRVAEGADYVGLGPFRFTHTKQNLSPTLGIEGYSKLMQQMTAAGFSTPIIAIGGITPDDIGLLKQTGIHGVAMSGALAGAADPKQTVHQIQQALC